MDAVLRAKRSKATKQELDCFVATAPRDDEECSVVMAGLGPAIHAVCRREDVDARDKHGHDGLRVDARP